MFKQTLTNKRNASKEYYRYHGKTYHKSQINYIGLGMAARRREMNEKLALFVPDFVNLWAHEHFATEAERYFFWLGYESYPYVAD